MRAATISLPSGLHSSQHGSGIVVGRGRPSREEEWPAWDEGKQSVLVLNTPSSGGSHVRSRLRRILCEEWATVPDKYVPST